MKIVIGLCAAVTVYSVFKMGKIADTESGCE